MAPRTGEADTGTTPQHAPAHCAEVKESGGEHAPLHGKTQFHQKATTISDLKAPGQVHKIIFRFWQQLFRGYRLIFQIQQNRYLSG